VDAIIYTARSLAEEAGKDSTGDQSRSILQRLEQIGDREVVGDPYEDHASGSKSNRGPALAAAIEAAEANAPCELWVHHTSRLGRGRGGKGEARALGKLLYDLKAAGVTVRSVADDEFATKEILWGIASQQSSEYATTLGANVKRGHVGCVTQRHQWRGGILPGGYEPKYEHGPNGKLVRRWLVKHTEDEPHYDLIWRMAEQGASMQRISLELGRAGALTRPVRTGFKRQPFTTNRVQQVLNNPFYAGQQNYQDETFEGDWPTYIDIGTFRRLEIERDKRSGGGTKRGVGRPREGYLLSGLAQCGFCGASMQGVKDASRVRHYVCHNRREYDPSSEHHCSAPILDATAVDEVVVTGIDHLLGDAAALLEQLETGQRAERDHLKREATTAADDAKDAERDAERATNEFASATDDDERALLKDAAMQKRHQAASARTRADAALDALNGDQAIADPAAAATALRERLSGKIEEAGEDVKVLNAALRESFDTFSLKHTERGFQIVPTLTDEQAWLLLEPAGAFSLG
jgi:Recombinase zinc beta ribbon domain/Resolvase, N terminal domain/Recombinase